MALDSSSPSEAFYRAVYGLGKHLEQNLTLDDEGSCALLFGGKWPLLIQYMAQEARAFVAVKLTDPAKFYTESELLSLVESGWLGMETSGIALSPDRAGGGVVGWRALPVENVTDESLLQALENFLADAHELRGRLERQALEDTATGSSSAPPTAPSFDVFQRFA